MNTAIVVGAGVFGASTARELARRGWDVTLVEQYTPGNVRSASGGDTRLIRFAHGEAEWYSRPALRGLELWRELEAGDAATRLFEPVGVAWFGTGDGDFLDAARRRSRRLGDPVRAARRPRRRGGCTRRSAATTCTPSCSSPSGRHLRAAGDPGARPRLRVETRRVDTG